MVGQSVEKRARYSVEHSVFHSAAQKAVRLVLKKVDRRVARSAAASAVLLVDQKAVYLVDLWAERWAAYLVEPKVGMMAAHLVVD